MPYQRISYKKLIEGVISMHNRSCGSKRHRLAIIDKTQDKQRRIKVVLENSDNSIAEIAALAQGNQDIAIFNDQWLYRSLLHSMASELVKIKSEIPVLSDISEK